MATWKWRERFRLTVPFFKPVDVDQHYANLRELDRTVNGLYIVPTGGVIQWVLTDIPEGWLLCDGSAVSRSTYRDLFNLLNSQTLPFGSGDGSTTFNVPDLRGRVPVGLKSTDTSFDVMGETGGAATVTLTSAEMPSHTHTQDAHTHGPLASSSMDNFWQMDSAAANAIAAGVDYQANNLVATTGPTTATNQNTGGGGAHANLQPYIVLNFIIRT